MQNALSLISEIATPILNKYNEITVDALDEVDIFINKVRVGNDVSKKEILQFTSSALFLISAPSAQVKLAVVTKASNSLREFILGEDKDSNNFMHFVAKYSVLKLLSTEQLESIVQWALKTQSTTSVTSVISNAFSLTVSATLGFSPFSQQNDNSPKPAIKKMLLKTNKMNISAFDMALLVGNYPFLNWCETLGGQYLNFDLKLYPHLQSAVKNDYVGIFKYLLEKAKAHNFLHNNQEIKKLIDLILTTAEVKQFISLMIGILTPELLTYFINQGLKSSPTATLDILVDLKKLLSEDFFNNREYITQLFLIAHKSDCMDKFVYLMQDKLPPASIDFLFELVLGLPPKDCLNTLTKLQPFLSHLYTSEVNVNKLIALAVQCDSLDQFAALSKNQLSTAATTLLFDTILQLPLEKSLQSIITLHKHGMHSTDDHKIVIFNKLSMTVGNSSAPKSQNQKFDRNIGTLFAYKPTSNVPQAINELMKYMKERYNIKSKYRPGWFTCFGYTREEKIFCVTKLIAALSQKTGVQPFTKDEIKCLTQWNSRTKKIVTKLFPGIKASNFADKIAALPNISLNEPARLAGL